MNLVSYVKEKGVRRAFQVLWRYKIPKLQIKIVAKLTRRRPLEGKIVIESHNDFDCNGGAFYEYLVGKGLNQTVKIVWRLGHPLDRKLPENVVSVPLYGPSWRKAWHICTAKWMTADCVVEEKVRDDQISLYMSHGVLGLKNVKGLISIPSTVDYVLSPSVSADEALAKGYDMDRTSTRFVHLGYPVLDRLFEKRHSKQYRPVSPAGKKVFLWMPTFRKGTAYGREDAAGSYPYGVPLIEDRETLDRLAEFANEKNALVVIKLHPKQDLSEISLDVPRGIQFIAPMDVKALPFDMYDLMLESVAMISDYSAATFEYLALDKPISYVLADLDRYKLGLVEHADRYMPGEKICTLQDLFAFITDVCAGVDVHSDERANFRTQFCRWNDSGSSERVSRFLGIE